MALSDLFEQQGVPQVGIGNTHVPVRFSDTTAEYWATRRAAGLFDFSFMAHFEITGPGSLDYLQYLQTRDLKQLATQQIFYTLLCNDDGTIFIDATVWRLKDGRYWLFTGRRTDARYLIAIAQDFNVQVRDLSGTYSVLALQGPHSMPILQRYLLGADLRTLRYFRFLETEILDTTCQIGRLGYTGEFGYEIIVPASAADVIWAQLLSTGQVAGLLPCGFAAADILRIEAGFILFSRELACPVTPYEINFGRFLSCCRQDFVGAGALRKQRYQSLGLKLAGLHLPYAPDSQQLPACQEPPVNQEAILTSSCESPLFGRAIGMGFVPAENDYPGSHVYIDHRLSAHVARLPFYDPGQRLPRQMPQRH